MAFSIRASVLNLGMLVKGNHELGQFNGLNVSPLLSNSNVEALTPCDGIWKLGFWEVIGVR